MNLQVNHLSKFYYLNLYLINLQLIHIQGSYYIQMCGLKVNSYAYS